MINIDTKTKAQGWELEVVCKNRTYLNEVVNAILKYGMINFEVNNIDGSYNYDGEFEGSYTVLMWCHWFHNLSNIAKDLEEIEKRLDVS